MRALEHRFSLSLTAIGVLVATSSLACELPPGFTNPPRPQIAPLEQLMSLSQEKEIALSLADVRRSANRPLRIDATKDLPGVSGTLRLSDGPYGTVGARRLVCLTDGSTSVEEVLLTESTPQSSRFRYVVWNHTNPKYKNVAYAVGEFVRTQPTPDRTNVKWTYRFALKPGVSAEERSRFQKIFLEKEFATWMRTQMDRKPEDAEAARPGQ